MATHSLDHGGFPSVLVAVTVWPSANSPHSLSLTASTKDVLELYPITIGLSHSKPVYLSKRKSIIDLAQGKPANPLLSLAKAYSIKFSTFAEKKPNITPCYWGPLNGLFFQTFLLSSLCSTMGIATANQQGYKVD